MKSIYIRSFNNPDLKQYLLPLTSENSLDFLKENIFDLSGIPIEDQVLYWNGKLIYNETGLKHLTSGAVIDVSLRLKGGKGGLRNQLRGEMRKNSNKDNIESCRDLLGRRIRDVKQKEKLIEWLKKKREEDKMIQKEVNEFNRMNKETVGRQGTFKLPQEFKDKLEKWESEMSSSVRKGVKATKKGAEIVKLGVRVRGEDESLEEPEIIKKIFTEIEMAKIIEENDEKDSKIEFFDIERPKENFSLETNNIEMEPIKVVYKEIDLNQVKTIEDLVNLGAEHLKNELMRLGLKCGGDLKERAQRLFDIKMNPNLLFNPKYIAKKKTK